MLNLGLAKKFWLLAQRLLPNSLTGTTASTAVLFGDGAGATIIEAVPEPYGIKSFVLGADGSGAEYLHMRAVGKCLPSGVLD